MFALLHFRHALFLEHLVEQLELVDAREVGLLLEETDSVGVGRGRCAAQADRWAARYRGARSEIF
jgi:hypothetical protein